VGEDGETHQGAFDISYLRPIPNMTLLAPASGKSLEFAMEFVKDFPTPCAFRYPRGSFILEEENPKPFELGKSVLLSRGDSKILFIGYGNGVGRAVETAKILGRDISILDLRFVKPLDRDMLVDLAKSHSRWFIFSDSAKIGGVGSAILELLSDEQIGGVEVISFEYEDSFIPHGNTKLVEESLGLLPKQLADKISKLIG